MNAFIKAAADNRAKGNGEWARTIEAWGRTAGKLVDHALASGYAVSVSDGEEWVVRKSTSKRDIIDALFSTDGDLLVLRAADGTKIATISLIYGNGPDELIADYSAPDLDAFTEWLKPVSEYADQQAF